MDTNNISNGALLKAFGQMKIVKTSSGPVEPATAEVIKVCNDKILKPLKKDQTSESFDSRRYTMNARLESSNKFLTTRDLYNRIVNDLRSKSLLEASNRTPYRGMRLDLSSIDMAETHCKFSVERRGGMYIVELFYPNVNDAITVSIMDEAENRKLYEVTLDSDQYTVNFGYTILKSIDELASEMGSASIEDMTSGTMMGNLGAPMHTVDETYLQPSALVMESVDWRLHKLKALCEAAGDAQDPAAAEFAADAPADPAAAIDAGAQMMAPSETEPAGDDEETTTKYTDYCHSGKLGEGADITAGGHIDHMTTILKSIRSKIPQYMPASGDSNTDLENQQPDAILNAFGIAYNFIHTPDDPMVEKAAKHGVKVKSEADHEAEKDENGLIISPEVRDNEDCFTDDIWTAIFDALGPNFVDKLTFDQQLSEILPKVFDATGNRISTKNLQGGLELKSEMDSGANEGTPVGDGGMDMGMGQDMAPVPDTIPDPYGTSWM